MIIVALLFLCFSFVAQADVFQWFDGAGQSHFSDKPHQGAKIFKLELSHRYYQVKKVYDGDTILLKNGKKVRFLGVNTPEVEGRNKEAQAGGEEAKQWLKARLKNSKVRLEVDVEKKDKYGRLLAHIFTEDKLHINLELVKLGLASVNIYPPNLKYVSELVKAEQKAESDNKGVWKYEEFKPKQAENVVTGAFKGWQRVVGKIKNIRHTRKNSYLVFTDRFSLRINKKAHKYFLGLEVYAGKRVAVNGWINKRKQKYNMFIRHPSAIKLLE